MSGGAVEVGVLGSGRGASDWKTSPPVGWGGRAWRPVDFYSAGLEGRLLAGLAECLECELDAVRGVLDAHAVLRSAYDAGWKDWEAESIRRAEKALDDATQAQRITVRRSRVEKGVLHTWEEETLVPPSVEAVKFKLERRDRERFGKDVRPEAPSVERSMVDRVSTLLLEKGLGAIEAERKGDSGGKP